MDPVSATARHLGSWPVIAPIFASGFACGVVWLRRRWARARDRGRGEGLARSFNRAQNQIAAGVSRAKPANNADVFSIDHTVGGCAGLRRGALRAGRFDLVHDQGKRSGAALTAR
jgi:hypothetical protein